MPPYTLTLFKTLLLSFRSPITFLKTFLSTLRKQTTGYERENQQYEKFPQNFGKIFGQFRN